LFEKSMEYPRHVALIPDGNRTRAKEHWLEQMEWHFAWFQRSIDLAIYIFENTPIEVFTLWGLSTENLKQRTEYELSYLFTLYEKITENLYEMMKKNQVNFRVVWDITKLPQHLQDFLIEKQQEFSFDSPKCFVLALNYGWQDEILRAINKLVESWENVTKENLEKYLDFYGLPTVDFVIRTKQKLAKRLSWFMLWRIGYAQLYFTDLYCPDFSIEEFNHALMWWNTTLSSQNFGK
jgi:undecaprenyl diphosphate synthase